MTGRTITRAALARLFKVSLRTIDRHGIARGELLCRKEAAARLGMSLATFDRRRQLVGFPEPVKPLGFPQWDAQVLDRWQAAQAPREQLNLEL